MWKILFKPDILTVQKLEIESIEIRDVLFCLYKPNSNNHTIDIKQDKNIMLNPIKVR